MSKRSPVKIEPFGVRADVAAEMVGLSERVFERLRAAGWIKPVVISHRVVLYDTSDVFLLWNKIKREGLPSRMMLETPDQDPASPVGA
jgi:hypothetical protein